uniref:NADH:ubiquinone reductase (H(+)-translocating) n=1 Tax=Petrobiona massiliana TaxID=68578 RepID=A0A140CUT7_9METZ|nr:NADH dehydrogenase subunit 5 [Petrobiona massiliana]
MLGLVLGVMWLRRCRVSRFFLTSLYVLMFYSLMMVMSEDVSCWCAVGWSLGHPLLGNRLMMWWGAGTIIMMALCWTTSMVMAFAVSYISMDPYMRRFILTLWSFFLSILVMILSKDGVSFLVGWEGMGLTSYCLIAFWATRRRCIVAAYQAVIYNIPGDSFLIIGLMIMIMGMGDPLLVDKSMGVWTSMCFLVAMISKSAQLGCHPWLPAAMEGPTPVSMLLHASTLVTAGAILMLRMGFDYAIWSLMLVGGLTCLLASMAGLEIKDMKRTIAFSTCSQIGLVLVCCMAGLGWPGLQHLLGHAFFKSLLFVGVGLLIHSSGDCQGIKQMRGGMGKLVLTWPLLLASLSLVGIPTLSGGLSKERCISSLISIGYWGTTFAMLLISAAMITTLYSTQLLASVNKKNWSDNSESSWTLSNGNGIIHLVYFIWK